MTVCIVCQFVKWFSTGSKVVGVFNTTHIPPCPLPAACHKHYSLFQLISLKFDQCSGRPGFVHIMQKKKNDSSLLFAGFHVCVHVFEVEASESSQCITDKSFPSQIKLNYNQTNMFFLLSIVFATLSEHIS